MPTMDSPAPLTPADLPPTKVAFIGAGPTGKAHVLAFKDVPGVRLAGIMNRFGAPLRRFIEENLTMVGIVGILAIIGGFAAAKFLF